MSSLSCHVCDATCLQVKYNKVQNENWINVEPATTRSSHYEYNLYPSSLYWFYSGARLLGGAPRVFLCHECWKSPNDLCY